MYTLKRRLTAVRARSSVTKYQYFFRYPNILGKILILANTTSPEDMRIYDLIQISFS